MRKNFYDWCIENNRQDLLDRFNTDLNNESVFDISWGTSKKYFFNCDRNKSHRPTYIRIASITSANQNIKCIDCLSFAQWAIDYGGEDYLNKIWNYDLNKESPWNVRAFSHQPIYLNCVDIDYHKGFKTTPASFVGNNHSCGFCNKSQVHKNDSFAIFNIDKYGDDFLSKYWDYDKNTINPYSISAKSGEMVWIKCQDKDYHGSYKVRAYDFSSDKSHCPYCRAIKIHEFDSIGYNFPQSLFLWSNKNDITPFDIGINSGKKIYLRCENNIHKDYQVEARYAVYSNFHCRLCCIEENVSYLEQEFLDYMKSKYDFNILRERECSLIAINPKTGKELLYDNDIIVYNNSHLIVEVNGKHHYEINQLIELGATKDNITPQQELEYQQWKDEYKKQFALSNGYHYLALPYTSFKDDSYKTLIDNKISEILSLTTKTNIKE